MTGLEQEIAHLQELQAKHHKNIRTLEEMLANYGMDRPLPLVNNLEFEQEQLRRVEERLTAARATQAKTEELQAGRGVMTMEVVNDYLARAVAAFEARMYQLVARPAAPPDQPYKFLYAFEIEDADIFFGRDAASEAFYQTVLKDRLTVLHAKSGAGKTSLLNAGLSPRLICEGRLPVYARAYEDPVLAIKRTIAPPSLGPWPELLPKLTLHEFLGLACAHLSRQTQELVIILDQFEELFIFWPEQDQRQPFIDTLADCYDDKALPVRLIIALRKDYYSDLAAFQRRLPHIFHNEYYLEAMARQEAQAAVTSPVEKLGRPVAYEQALLDMLLDDLARGGMELPHLQIICTRLYGTLAEGETTITLTSYEKLGWAEGVLGGYLNSVLDRLPGRGRTIAREVLKELVSSEATKRVLSYDTLAARVGVEEDVELDGVLAQLVDARLLRRDEVAGEIKYEMAHEYLIEEIKEWIDRADLAFKQAQELLVREMASWRMHGTLVPRDRLELLHAHRERFRGLDAEAWECLLRSALQADFAVEDWAKLAGEVSIELLIAALRGEGSDVRRVAAKALGRIGKPVVEPLITALRDEDSDVRRKAAEVLGEVGDRRAVEPLSAVLQDERRGVRMAAVEALGKIGDRRAVEPLSAALQDEDSDVRRKAAEALWRIGEPAVEPLIVALQDGSTYVRMAAAEAMGEIGDRRVVEPLIVALQDGSSDMRWRAADALGEIGDPRAVEPLIAALQDDGGGVRMSAAEALRGIGEPAVEPLITSLRNENINARMAAADALWQIGEPAVEPLIAALQDENSNARKAAAYALGGIRDPRAVEPLIAALQDDDRSVRLVASAQLGNLGDWRAVEPLIVALQDGSSDMRWRAADALGKIGDPRAVEPLIAALQDDDSSVRSEAAKALGQLGDPRAVEPLSIALQDEAVNVRRETALSLAQLGDLRAMEPLITVLQDEDSIGHHWEAARALGQLGDPRAVEPLIAALRGERDPDVCRAIAEALKRIGTLEALAALEK